MRWSLASLVLVMLVLSLTGHHASSTEPETAQALVGIETTFNHDYQVNDDGPVWDRWDHASQSLITRPRYVLWHHECPTSPGVAVSASAIHLSGPWWRANYSIAGVALHDLWHQEQGKWRFSLLRSNPSAVALYTSSFAHYARATGCRAG